MDRTVTLKNVLGKGESYLIIIKVANSQSATREVTMGTAQ